MARFGPLEPLEIRIHPHDGRGRGRSLLLTVRRQRVLLGAAALALAILVTGALAAPSVIGSWRRQQQYQVEMSRRLQLGERLQALVEQLAGLERRGDELARRLDRIQRIYGLDDGLGAAGRVEGLGREVPETIFASTIAHGNRVEGELAEELRLIRARLDRIVAFEVAHPERPREVPARLPLRGEEFVRTSGFGNRRSPFTRELEMHAGLDLAAPLGTQILAPAAGRVTHAGPVEADRRSDWWRMGRMVVLRHGESYLTLYGHCDRILVREGQRVAAGEPIATVGESGWTTAPHLHYEIRRLEGGAWRAVDPFAHALDLPVSGPAPPAGSAAEAPALLPAFLR